MPFVAQNIDALIPLFLGACGTYLAFRGVPAGSPNAVESAQWHARWGRLLKVLGPILMLTGLARLLPELAA